MIITTGFIPHEDIAEYCGIVSGTIVAGIGFSKDWFAAIKDITGGRIKGYEQSIESVREEAVAAMERAAKQKGADAIIMVRMSFEVFSPAEKGTVVGGIVYGTAVKLKETNKKEIEINGMKNNEANEYRSKGLDDKEPEIKVFGPGFDWKK